MTPLPRRAPDAVQDQVMAHALAAVLDRHEGRLRVLSLDCFDTIVWRRTATPVDVFYALQDRPAFRALGFSARLRVQAESRARSLRQMRDGSSEVRLDEIYRAAFPHLDDAQVAELAEAELASEMEACYAFPPAVSLIRAAQARGLPIVVVSDTYFVAAELRRLLGAVLPADAAASIDHVFCSSDHRRAKAEGLFARVLERLKGRPDTYLHIGDNPGADVVPAKAAGMRALHLLHHPPEVREVVRLQAPALSLLAPDVRHREPLPSPYRGVHAATPLQRIEDVLGQVTLGPIIHAFARFVLDEEEALRARGARPKLLFLMRDAHLPRQVAGVIAGHDAGPAVRISRFASYAASFRTVADVDDYLARFAGSGRFEDLSRQLLLPAMLAAEIATDARASKQPLREYVARIHAPDVLEVVFEASRAYRERLRRYLVATAGLERGDTAVFVDLGYEGTAQQRLAPVFREEWGIEVVGRYLIAVGTPGWAASRAGLIDPSWCDDRVIRQLVEHVAVLENLCTSPDESVVDYDEDGGAICAPSVIPPEQFAKIAPVQAACQDFARRAEDFFAATGQASDPHALRLAALGHLGRLFHFATREELAFLEGLRLDMNLATTDQFQLFDLGEGMTGLRKRGLQFMEQDLRSRRMNYPFELRYAGLELALALAAQQRFALGFVHGDLALRREEVPALLIRGMRSTNVTLEAHATHDGFFSLIAPVGEGDLNVGILFGKRYTSLQIESVERIPTAALHGHGESQRTEDITGLVALDGMSERPGGVYECDAEAAFLFIPADPDACGGRRAACRIVFRPLAYR